jgi:aspartyl/glutamyl-tRNA(Asn/Gln) amidotransferase C subunit
MISKEEIQALAALARLSLTEEEEVALQKDISNILEYVGQVNTASGDSAASYSALKNVLRADVSREEGDLLADKREALLKALPAREGDYAAVRKIIEK